LFKVKYSLLLYPACIAGRKFFLTVLSNRHSLLHCNFTSYFTFRMLYALGSEETNGQPETEYKKYFFIEMCFDLKKISLRRLS